MAWSGYFHFGGTEVVNATRTEAYARNHNLGWFKPVYNETALPWLIGDPQYTTPLQDDAPWTDSDDLNSYDFYGAYPLEVTGFEDATVAGNVTESVIDGGYVGRVRRSTRSLVFSAVLVGASECAVEYGMRWLRATLNGGPCFGAVYGNCGGADLCYLACPPVIGETSGNSETVLVPPEPVLEGVNLAQNPALEGNVLDGWLTQDANQYSIVLDSAAPISGTRSAKLTALAGRNTTVAATNLATNPALEGGALTGWNSNDPSLYPVTRDTTAPISGTASAMTTRTATSPNPVISSLYLPGSGLNGLPVTPGNAIAASIDVKCEQPSRKIDAQFFWYDASGTYLSASVLTVLLADTGAALKINRVSHTATPPPSAAFGVLSVGADTAAGNAPTGERVWWDNLMVVMAATAPPYFDGDTPADANFSYKWTGTAKASTSQKMAMSQHGFTALLSGQNGSAQIPITPGTPITLSLDYRSDASGRAIYAPLYYYDAGGNYLSNSPFIQVDTSVANEVRRISATITPPAGAVTALWIIDVYATSGAVPVGERMWLDRLRIGGADYFDGDSEADDFWAHDYAWTGTPLASSSTLTALPVPYPQDSVLSAEDCYAKLGRSLHNVTTITGPVVTQKLTLNDGGVAWTVTWTMVAANPAEFGIERPLIQGFLDPAVDIPYVGGVVPPGASFDPDGFVQTDEPCPLVAFQPVYDPTCALLTPPPPVPTVVPMCFDFPANYLRRSFTIPTESIPLWTEVVPVVSLHTSTTEARSVRLRFYADVFSTGTPDSDPCNFCGDIVFAYLPAHSTVVFDGADHLVYVDTPGLGRRRADALVSGSDGSPFEWPQFSCGFGYIVTVDTPQQSVTPVIDLALVPRVA